MMCFFLSSSLRSTFDCVASILRPGESLCASELLPLLSSSPRQSVPVHPLLLLLFVFVFFPKPRRLARPKNIEAQNFLHGDGDMSAFGSTSPVVKLIVSCAYVQYGFSRSQVFSIHITLHSVKACLDSLVLEETLLFAIGISPRAASSSFGPTTFGALAACYFPPPVMMMPLARIYTPLS